MWFFSTNIVQIKVALKNISITFRSCLCGLRTCLGCCDTGPRPHSREHPNISPFTRSKALWTFLKFFHGANNYSNTCLIQSYINKIDRLYYALKSNAFIKHSRIDRQINMQVVITWDKTEFIPWFLVLALRLCRNRNSWKWGMCTS